MEPVDGGPSWREHICPQLSWVLLFLLKHLGCPLGRQKGGVATCIPNPGLGFAGPILLPTESGISLDPSYVSLGKPSLTSRVWAAIRWARPLGMPILMAPSARASENTHTCSSSMGGQLNSDTVPVWRRLRASRNRAQGRATDAQSQMWKQKSCQVLQEADQSVKF
jgi:hypothetical protein